MICPQCQATIAPGARFCAGCGARQQPAAAPAPAGPAAATHVAPPDGQAMTVPLTDEQRNWLRANVVLPVIIVWVAIGVMALFFSCLFGGALAHTIGKVFAGVLGLMALGMLVATWLHVRNNLADLRLGVAEVRTARLLRRTSTSQSPRSFYLELEGVGSVTVMADQSEGLVDGNVYRITYSPHTRKGWRVEVPGS